MGKQDLYTVTWFVSRGYTFDDKTGSWNPPPFRNPLREPEASPLKRKEDENKLEKIEPYKKYKYSKNLNIKLSGEVQLSNPLDSVISIEGLVPGLNGDKGLMRSHWSDTKRQKEFYKSVIENHLIENKARKHTGKVTVQYIGYKSILMDWDNFCSSFKHIGDSLVDKEIIKEDKPSVVIQFIPQQIKCKRDEQKVVIIIKDFT